MIDVIIDHWKNIEKHRDIKELFDFSVSDESENIEVFKWSGIIELPQHCVDWTVGNVKLERFVVEPSLLAVKIDYTEL